ncbi:MAG TPA: hypothetical protein VIB08_01695 [Thermoanaerobaculia bacterium]|jgi:hypothetical protein
MNDTKTPPSNPEPAEELRQLGAALSALGRSAFAGGRVLSAELLRKARTIVDSAREEIDKLAEKEKKQP